MSVEVCKTFVNLIGFSYKPTPVWSIKLSEYNKEYHIIKPTLNLYFWDVLIIVEIPVLKHYAKKQYGSLSESYSILFGGIDKKHFSVEWGDL